MLMGDAPTQDASLPRPSRPSPPSASGVSPAGWTALRVPSPRLRSQASSCHPRHFASPTTTSAPTARTAPSSIPRGVKGPALPSPSCSLRHESAIVVRRPHGVLCLHPVHCDAGPATVWLPSSKSSPAALGPGHSNSHRASSMRLKMSSAARRGRSQPPVLAPTSRNASR
jgi:hypothetical protein